MEAITEKSLPGTVSPVVMAWSPVVDLMAFVPEDSSGVWVYRLNGQRVWVYANNSKVAIVQLQWKQDGKLLAMTLEDGSWKILSSATGKPVEQGASSANASFVTWSRRVTGEPTADPNAMPYNLLDVDIARNLPKLPPLVSNFQAFAAVSLDEVPSDAELIAVGTKDGGFNLSLYGVFEIGAVRCDITGKVLQLEGNDELSEHVAVVDDGTNKHLVMWNIDFIRKYGPAFLPEVSISPARIMSLIAYIKDAVNTIKQETEGLLDQTDKSMLGLGDDKVQIGCDLFDTLITGVVKTSVKTWLKSHLGERGLKKWHKACIYGYETASKVLFENVIPAVERLILLLTKMKGLAEWEDRGKPLGLVAADYEAAIGNAVKLMKSAIALMQESSREFELFKAFSTWLEVVYEQLPNTSMTTRMHENPEAVKTTDVGAFITEYLNKSVVKKYMLNGEPESLDKIAHKLDAQCTTAFENVKAAMRTQIKPQQYQQLSPSDHHVICRYHHKSGKMYILITKGNQAWFCRYAQPERGQQISTIETCLVRDDEIMQAGFIDDESILVLSQANESHHLKMCNYPEDSQWQTVTCTGQIDLKTLCQNQPPVEFNTYESRSIDSNSPTAFAINGPRKVATLLYKDKRHYEFFALEPAAGDGNDDDNDDDVNDVTMSY